VHEVIILGKKGENIVEKEMRGQNKFVIVV
jgi:hypothetical protein